MPSSVFHTQHAFPHSPPRAPHRISLSIPYAHPGAHTEAIRQSQGRWRSSTHAPHCTDGETGSEREGAGPGSHRKQRQDLDWELVLCHPTLPQHPSPTTSHAPKAGGLPLHTADTRDLSHIPGLEVFLVWDPDQGPPPLCPSTEFHPPLHEPRALKSSVIIHGEINPGI